MSVQMLLWTSQKGALRRVCVVSVIVKEEHGDKRNRTRRESLGSLDVEREDGRSHPRPSLRNPKLVVGLADRQAMKDNILQAFVRAVFRGRL